jgi:hypothetical protein
MLWGIWIDTQALGADEGPVLHTVATQVTESPPAVMAFSLVFVHAREFFHTIVSTTRLCVPANLQVQVGTVDQLDGSRVDVVWGLRIAERGAVDNGGVVDDGRRSERARGIVRNGDDHNLAGLQQREVASEVVSPDVRDGVLWGHCVARSRHGVILKGARNVSNDNTKSEKLDAHTHTHTKHKQHKLTVMARMMRRGSMLSMSVRSVALTMTPPDPELVTVSWIV